MTDIDKVARELAEMFWQWRYDCLPDMNPELIIKAVLVNQEEGNAKDAAEWRKYKHRRCHTCTPGTTLPNGDYNKRCFTCNHYDRWQEGANR